MSQTAMSRTFTNTHRTAPRARGTLRVCTVLIVLGALAMTACGSPPRSADSGRATGSDVFLTGARWAVDSLTVDEKRTQAPDGAYVEFDDKGGDGGKGTVGGVYGCNQFSADAVVEGDTVTVEPVMVTQMACEKKIQDFEDDFRKLFTGRFEAELKDGRLTLTNPAGDTVALTEREQAPEPAAQLTGVRWRVDSLIDGETVSSLPEGADGRNVEAVLTFEEGRVTGNLGCNGFSAPVEIADGKITFGRIASTRKLCSDPAMKTERALSKILSGEVDYRVEQRFLTLTTADGTGLRAKTG